MEELCAEFSQHNLMKLYKQKKRKYDYKQFINFIDMDHSVLRQSFYILQKIAGVVKRSFFSLKSLISVGYIRVSENTN